MGYPWIMRSDVGAPAAEALTTAFLEMDRADLLDLMGTTGYAEVGPADYAELKQYAEDLGLLNAGR
jgi:ABC-type phosphate/phosphonate transport system substrate-binding protein